MRIPALRSNTVISIFGILLSGTAFLPGAPGLRARPQSPPVLVCTGTHDLSVDGDQVTMTGAYTFDRVCLQNRATLRMSGMLRAGALFVDTSSRLSADGQTDEAQYPTPCNDRQAGGTLTIVTREAVVLGHISANGEAGFDGFTGCGYDGGNGGNGGRLTLEAATLTLHGDMSATGGKGGGGYTGDPTIGSHGGNGANGGSITLITGQPLTAAVTARLHVGGGRGGHPGSDRVKTKSGRRGHIALARLSPAQWTHLPPPPPADITALTPSPVHVPMLPPNVFATGVACGHEDLRLAPEGAMILGGNHTYGHICLGRGAILTASAPLNLHAQTILLDSGATLVSAASLILQAQTIVLRAGATIQADAVIGASRHGLDTGRYQDAGACQPDHAPVHPGVPGTTGQTGQAPGTTNVLDEQTYTPQAGAGGGAVTVVAERVLLAGTLSAGTASREPMALSSPRMSLHQPVAQGAARAAASWSWSMTFSYPGTSRSQVAWAALEGSGIQPMSPTVGCTADPAA